MSDVEILQVIHTRLLRRGDGKSEKDPIRIIDQYWMMDGTMLFEWDNFTGNMRSEVHQQQEKQ